MAEFFRKSKTWVIRFRYDGRSRQWFRVFPEGLNPEQLMRDELDTLYGKRAMLEQVRLATEEEDLQFLRGEEVRNTYCPTGRWPDSALGGAASSRSPTHTESPATTASGQCSSLPALK